MLDRKKKKTTEALQQTVRFCLHGKFLASRHSAVLLSYELYSTAQQRCLR